MAPQKPPTAGEDGLHSLPREDETLPASGSGIKDCLHRLPREGETPPANGSCTKAPQDASPCEVSIGGR